MDYSSQSTQPLKVIADDRERASGVIESLADSEGISVEVHRLKLGDFDINDRLLVERKTTLDFGLSIIDGRLFRQAYRLANSGRRCCFILEGPPSNLNISRESLQGAMITVTLVFGLPFLRSRTPEETAWLIVTASRQLSRSEAQIPARLVRRKNRKPRGIQSQMLQALPSIGPDRANSLLEFFGDIQTVVSADLAAFMEVPGIGEATATRILQALDHFPE